MPTTVEELLAAARATLLRLTPVDAHAAICDGALLVPSGRALRTPRTNWAPILWAQAVLSCTDCPRASLGGLTIVSRRPTVDDVAERLGVTKDCRAITPEEAADVVLPGSGDDGLDRHADDRQAARHAVQRERA